MFFTIHFLKLVKIIFPIMLTNCRVLPEVPGFLLQTSYKAISLWK